MMSRRSLIIGLPIVVLFAVTSVAHARTLYESARIALYSTEAEPGSRNSHPITLEADQLSAALSRVRASSGETGEIIDLFPGKNCVEAAERLAKGLRSIDPDQELQLVSFRRIGTFFSSKRYASAARIFMERGRLNLIFGQIDLFFSEFRDPDRPVPPVGSRKQVASLKGGIMPAEGVTFVDGRNDWVALELVRAATPLPPAAPPAEESDQTTEVTSQRAANKPQETNIEEKLQILRTLRDKELITEQEYVEKKRQILDNF